MENYCHERKVYCSGMDIAPTVANLLGLEYDSGLYMGKDILSTAEVTYLPKEEE